MAENESEPGADSALFGSAPKTLKPHQRVEARLASQVRSYLPDAFFSAPCTTSIVHQCCPACLLHIICCTSSSLKGSREAQATGKHGEHDRRGVGSRV